MAHPFFHALNLCRKWGGRVEDYIGLTAWFDFTKAVIPDARHRIVLHNTGGIVLFCNTFSKEYGAQSIVNSDGVHVPLVSIATQHVVEDFTFVPDLLEISDLFLLSENKFVEQYLKFNHMLTVEKLAYKYGEEKDFAVISRFFMGYAYLIPQATAEQKAAILTLLNNSFGIFLLEKYLGTMFTIESTGRQIPTRLIGENFVSGALNGVIPSLYEAVSTLPKQKWMFKNALNLEEHFTQGEIVSGSIDKDAEIDRVENSQIDRQIYNMPMFAGFKTEEERLAEYDAFIGVIRQKK